MPPKLWAKKVCRQKADYRIHHPFPFPQPAIPASWTLWTARGGKTRQQLQKRHCQRPHLERVLPFVVVASNPGPSVAKK